VPAPDAFVVGRAAIVGSEEPLDALPPPDEAVVRIGAETVEWVVTTGTATAGDPDVVGATFVGVGRTGAIAVAGDPVATGCGAVAVVGVPPGFAAAGATGFGGFAFRARALPAPFGQRRALRTGRALPRCFAHAVERDADIARARTVEAF
jgi:hypothetical protein